MSVDAFPAIGLHMKKVATMRAVSVFLFMTLPLASSAQEPSPPYGSSDIIAAIDWASADTIIPRARDGDNWPVTWADDTSRLFWGRQFQRPPRDGALDPVRDAKGSGRMICGQNNKNETAIEATLQT